MRLAPIAFVIAATAAGATPSPSANYAASWWRSLSNEERVEFVAGFFDCVIYDVRGTDSFDASLQALADAVTQYYRAHPARASTPVPDILTKTHVPGEAIPQDLRDANKHGYYDGDYWRQAYPAKSLREAFVRGYIACRTQNFPETYSKPMSSYVSELSAWYGVRGDDPAEIIATRSHDKIGELIVRMRDR